MTEVTTVYDRFTELAKRSLVAARDVADSLGTDFVGTEHLLLGLAQTAGTASEALRAHGVELGRTRAAVEAALRAAGAPSTAGGGAAEALSTIGIDVAEIQQRADSTFGPGVFRYPRPAFSLRLKEVIARSLQQARELGGEHIDTEHLLLALLSVDEDAAVRVLSQLGADIRALRQAVLDRVA
ncbi:Clp protease N-terminal domain-containing protein [Actinospica robiniae]|uniref:Clp protease N-terminal domain-containing protein n=1 Tax=Actinospica robiniae TaxID=304901 RepID=UPI000405527E|nr:Clp protease N-terminal domain-containing protein [Actinospica robiniae]